VIFKIKGTISKTGYLLTSIIFLDIIHRLVHFLKNNVLETGFCLRPRVKPTQLDPIDRASPYLRTPMSVGSNQVIYLMIRAAP
jgi:hypothetical protein